MMSINKSGKRMRINRRSPKISLTALQSIGVESIVKALTPAEIAPERQPTQLAPSVHSQCDFGKTEATIDSISTSLNGQKQSTTYPSYFVNNIAICGVETQLPCHSLKSPIRSANDHDEVLSSTEYPRGKNNEDVDSSSSSNELEPPNGGTGTDTDDDTEFTAHIATHKLETRILSSSNTPSRYMKSVSRSKPSLQRNSQERQNNDFAMQTDQMISRKSRRACKANNAIMAVSIMDEVVVPVVPRTSVIPNGEISKNLPAPDAPIAHIAHHVGTETTSNPPTYSSIHIHQVQPTTSEQSTPPTIATGASTPEYSHEQLHDAHMIQTCQMLKSTNVLTNVTRSPQSSGMPSSQITANQRDFNLPQATDVPPASANGSKSKQSLFNQATLEKLKPPPTIKQQKCNSFQATSRRGSGPTGILCLVQTDAASDTTCPSTLMQSNAIQIVQASATPAGHTSNSNVVPLVVQSDGKMSTFSRPMLQLGNPIKIYARILDFGVFNVVNNTRRLRIIWSQREWA
ncbi:putative cell surface flocculin [Reticulomyxa filosa]|uniref:Putative cell surface flocculin n=1 Tax=Reticulomyxa filosa TaxID=46433 RepID=X6M079_RETFI|nr:putative cell surface flocculin [Reticulomyxa filosa]|eukprot:ETO07588.1 putative cell surface flocculin [Reticulomyxa filosa]